MKAADWLLQPATARLDAAQLIAGLAEQLAPLQLIRLSTWLPTKHPELWGSQLIWNRGAGVKTIVRPHEIETTSAYVQSPGEALHSGRRPFVRCRLDQGPPEFPLLAEVAALGATDYFAHVLAADLDRPPWMAFATTRAGGFTDAQLAELTALVPLLGLRIGVGLHVGEVVYGNIGGRRRLDFTVIGAAVNEVCRVESLCKDLGTPLLMTDGFVRGLDGEVPTVGLGAHALKGVAAEKTVHTLPRYHRGG